MHLLLSLANNCAMGRRGKEKGFSYFKRPEAKPNHFFCIYIYIYYMHTHIWDSFLELEQFLSVSDHLLPTKAHQFKVIVTREDIIHDFIQNKE